MLALIKSIYGLNKPIYIKNIESSLGISNIYAKKLLKKWINDGEIKRFDNGIYYFPEKSELFGEKSFNIDEVLRDRYLGKKSNPQGYYSGLTLANTARITTQVPVVKFIVTNMEKGNGRNVKIGKITVRLSKPRKNINRNNIAALSLLDLISTAERYSEFSREETILKIQEFAKKMEITKCSVRDSIESYPAKTSQELIMMGVYDVLA
ncbi:MAG: hypothetical protein IJT01_10975 [Selenomonadaceae bacterium]|nr:hypothetical protein [Selenomonadaceae bacterium]